MAWRELKDVGLDIERDLAAIVFTGFPVGQGLDLVLEGVVDAATFRTGILEELVQQGDPRADQVRVLGERSIPGFDSRSSTRLYPEWPLALRGDLEMTVAQTILLAALNLEADHPAARAAGIAGWSAPRSYEEVHALMHALGVGLYAPEPIVFSEWVREHLLWPVLALLALLGLVLAYVLWVHARLRMAGENLQRAIGSIPNAVITLDARDAVVYMNPAAEVLVAWSSEQALGRSLRQVLDLRNPDTNHSLFSGLGKAPLAALGCQLDARLADVHGEDRIVRFTRTPLDPVGDSAARQLLVLTDMSEERRLLDQLRHEANHDALTGLLNRRAFERELERALHEASVQSSVASLLLVDLDYFKLVNDRHGHRVGDELLREVAMILQRLTRLPDVVARLGGDEFAVIAFRTDSENARILGTRICKALGDQPLQVEGREVTIGASVGVVELGPGLSSTDAASVAADRACYRAKAKGRCRVELAEETDLYPIAGN